MLTIFAMAPAVSTQSESWDVTTLCGVTREIDFVTREGTWMSVDLSADGQWIVFDLLGHVYRVAAAGGEAECLTQSSGVAINFHPVLLFLSPPVIGGLFDWQRLAGVRPMPRSRTCCF